MIDQIKTWWELLTDLAQAIELLLLFVFIIYPAVWITDRLSRHNGSPE